MKTRATRERNLICSLRRTEETTIDKNHEWLNKKLSEIHCDNGFLIALIKRNEDYFVPNGETKLLLDDMLIFYES